MDFCSADLTSYSEAWLSFYLKRFPTIHNVKGDLWNLFISRNSFLLVLKKIIKNNIITVQLKISVYLSILLLLLLLFKIRRGITKSMSMCFFVYYLFIHYTFRGNEVFTSHWCDLSLLCVKGPTCLNTNLWLVLWLSNRLKIFFF